MLFSSYFLRSRGSVISRDRDVIVMKVLKNINATSFFNLGSSLCTSKDTSINSMLEMSFIDLHVFLTNDRVLLHLDCLM